MFEFMKQKWKILAIVIGLLLLAGLSYFIIQMVFLLNPFPGSVRVDTIFIEKDEDFIEQDFPGSGTHQDPFRIENIQLGTYEYLHKERYKLIAIRNTTVHVLIQNCTFIGCEFGVYIDSVKEGFINIRNNTFIGREFQQFDQIFAGSISIKTTESENISITDNSFMGEIKPAIEIYKSSDLIISKNKIMINYKGAAVGSTNSSNIILDSNIITPDSSSPTRYCEGIYFMFSQNCSIENNIVREVSIYFRSCNNLELRNNTLVSEIEGFSLLSFFLAINVEITQNDFLGREHEGIVAESISNLTISNNTFDVGIRGLNLYDVQHTIIIYNSFYNSSDYAIWINVYSFNATIFHNNFFDNNLAGDSQCYNEDTESKWYNMVLSEGNYWNDLGSNLTYSIDGPAGSVDLYPLANPVI